MKKPWNFQDDHWDRAGGVWIPSDWTQPLKNLSLFLEEICPFSKQEPLSQPGEFKLLGLGNWGPRTAFMPGKDYSHTREVGTLRLLPLNSLEVKKCCCALSSNSIWWICPTPVLRVYFFTQRHLICFRTAPKARGWTLLLSFHGFRGAPGRPQTG